MNALVFDVAGVPGAQGNHRINRAGAIYDSSKRVGPWRDAVKIAAMLAIPRSDWTLRHRGPVRVVIDFTFTRPQSHYRTGSHATELRSDAPQFVTSRGAGDIDKIQRSTFDALVAAGVIHDDSQIVTVHAYKLWSDRGGAHIAVKAVG